MMYLTLVATVILGCILAIGPPAVWKGRLMDDDASRLPRFLGMFVAATCIRAVLTGADPLLPLTSMWERGTLWWGLGTGCLVVQCLTALGAAISVERWMSAARPAYELRKVGLTNAEIRALNSVDERSDLAESLPALRGFGKLAKRTMAAGVNLAATSRDLNDALDDVQDAPAATPPPHYSISDLVHYYALSNQAKTPGTWLECYHALCRAYQIPRDWEQDQLRRNHDDNRRQTDERIPYNLNYARLRLAFETPRVIAARSMVGPDDGKVDQRIHEHFVSAFDGLETTLRTLDRLFFSEIYHAPVEQTFPEADMVSRYGFPDATQRAEMFF